ncbi:hypothetical protein [Marinobacterium sp. xm-d-564]|uniref:type IV pilus modification PilV family protein n=1 Tax=Marinobacterium sp. xm-d-564 TaxID=2497742 RepID=UPI001568AB7D|nr:hypothetical protein [Marinobacterium sp. xm-d-564]NRP58504.1 hypothetical protein [Marinobacterium sp. xm-d-564]
MSQFNMSVKGFILIEAIIALVVSTVGLLGIALFSSSLLSESTDTKSKSEAIRIAQSRLDKLRQFAGQVELASIGSSSWAWPSSEGCEIYHSDTDTFYIDGELVSNATGSLQGTVNVSWGQPDCESENKVSLATIVASDVFDSTVINGSISDVDLSGIGSNIRPPTGNAEYGDDAPGGVLPAGLSLQDVIVSQAAGSNEIRLLGSVLNDDGTTSYKELLVTTDSAGFAEVRGVVYALNSSGVLPSDMSLVIKPSDTGVCPKGPLVSSVNGSFVEYTCFFGGGWYGNIPVFIGESTSPVVVGDPNCDDGSAGYSASECDASTIYDREPIWALNNQRLYRGYAIAFGDGGALLDADGNLVLVSRGLEAGDIYGYGSTIPYRVGGHDFVIAESTESASTASSLAVSTTDYNSLFANVSGAAFSNLIGNKGDFVCLDIDGSTNCPDQMISIGESSVSASRISISGSVIGGASAALASGLSDFEAINSVTSQFPSGLITSCYVLADGSCDELQSGTTPICINTSDQYQCDVYTSGAWTGEIRHELNELLTSTNPAYEICSPSGGVERFSNVSGSQSGSSIYISNNCASEGNFCTVDITSPTSTVTKNKTFDIQYTITNAAVGATSIAYTGLVQGVSSVTETQATVLAPKDAEKSFTLTVTNSSNGISCSDSITLSTTNN